MKKTLIALVIIAATTAMAAYYSPSIKGKVVTVTTTPQSVAVPGGGDAHSAMVSVRGAGRVYVMSNIATNDFVLTNAAPVEIWPPLPIGDASMSSGGSISNLVVATQSGTEEIFIVFEK